ncbi:MAG: ABC transporter substrate-binding protein [Nitrospira sp.]|nr:ABC transporter substrate-binding protein [Nitrospira sp.]MBH0180575.1 ABC transporter substrate-binding protein [Nitrospira sp.]MBH0186802.1 ABC transporter substrate-binding protein [Nitrospira sp.]
MPHTVFVLTCFLVLSLSRLAGATEIAILTSASLPYYDQAVVGFKAGLPATVTVKEYPLNGQLAEGRHLAKSLRAAPPDLIFAVGLKAAMAAKLEIFDAPVVFCMVLNPESHGLPAPNMTGIAVRPPADTQLAALRSTVPKQHRIGVLYDEEHSGSFIRQAHRAAKQQGLELHAVAIHRQEEIPNAVRALLPKIDVLWLIQDQTVVSESAIPFFLESTLDAKIPLFTFSLTLVQQGALGALVLDPWTVGQQAARLAQSRLNGNHTSAGVLQLPERPQMALNANAAEHLGVALSPELMRLAGHLFSGPGALAQKPGQSDVIP